MVRSKDFKQAVESIGILHNPSWGPPPATSGFQPSPRFFWFFSSSPLTPDASGSGRAPEVPSSLETAFNEERGEVGRRVEEIFGFTKGVGSCPSRTPLPLPTVSSLSYKAARFQLRDRAETINLARTLIAAQLAKGRLGAGGAVLVRQSSQFVFASSAFTLVGRFFFCAWTAPWEMVASP